MSSIAPTRAMKTVAANTSQRACPPRPGTPNRTHATTTPTVAAITAIPPPCGVGVLCDERTLGCASAWRLSRGCNSQIKTTLTSAEATNTSASSPMVVMSQPPQRDAGRNTAAIEACLDVDDDALAVVQQWHDQRPAGLIGIMRDRQHHRIGGLQCLELYQLDAVFAARMGGVGHRIVHLHGDAGRRQFAHDVDDFRIANIRHVFLEGETENGHALGPPAAVFNKAQAFARDFLSNRIVDAPAGENDLWIETGFLRAVGQIVRVDANAVAADQPGCEGKEIPFRARRGEHEMEFPSLHTRAGRRPLHWRRPLLSDPPRGESRFRSKDHSRRPARQRCGWKESRARMPAPY